MVTTKYLGISGVSSHDPQKVEKYNKLLDLIGVEGMLIQFERFIDDGELSDIITQVEDSLYECGIKLS
jgi:hypothetical protein